jgi:hypothetical protein
MTTGFTVGGVDLDNLFQPGSSGLTIGFKLANGTDIGARYAGYSSGTKAGVTGYKNTSGVDLKDLLAPIFPMPVTVNLSTSSLSATGFAGTTGTTGGVTATATGGTGTGYTYLWQFVSGDSSVVPNSPTSATTTFSRPSMGNGGSYGAQYKCVGTDSGSTSASSSTVSIAISSPVLTAHSSATGTAATAATAGAAVTTPTLTLSASGGSGSGYTFAWTQIDGDPSTTATAPSSATSAWHRSSTAVNAEYDSDWLGTVTDSLGNTASVAITITINGKQT